jgi:transposase
MARSGARWRDLPEDRFGSYQTAKRRYYRWIEMGVFDRQFEAVAADPNLEWLAIDATDRAATSRLWRGASTSPNDAKKVRSTLSNPARS